MLAFSSISMSRFASRESLSPSVSLSSLCKENHLVRMCSLSAQDLASNDSKPLNRFVPFLLCISYWVKREDLRYSPALVSCNMAVPDVFLVQESLLVPPAPSSPAHPYLCCPALSAQRAPSPEAPGSHPPPLTRGGSWSS